MARKKGSRGKKRKGSESSSKSSAAKINPEVEKNDKLSKNVSNVEKQQIGGLPEINTDESIAKENTSDLYNSNCNVPSNTHSIAMKRVCEIEFETSTKKHCDGSQSLDHSSTDIKSAFSSSNTEIKVSESNLKIPSEISENINSKTSINEQEIANLRNDETPQFNERTQFNECSDNSFTTDFCLENQSISKTDFETTTGCEMNVLTTTESEIQTNANNDQLCVKFHNNEDDTFIVKAKQVISNSMENCSLNLKEIKFSASNDEFMNNVQMQDNNTIENSEDISPQVNQRIIDLSDTPGIKHEQLFHPEIPSSNQHVEENSSTPFDKTNESRIQTNAVTSSFCQNNNYDIGNDEINEQIREEQNIEVFPSSTSVDIQNTEVINNCDCNLNTINNQQTNYDSINPEAESIFSHESEFVDDIEREQNLFDCFLPPVWKLARRDASNSFCIEELALHLACLNPGQSRGSSSLDFCKKVIGEQCRTLQANNTNVNDNLYDNQNPLSQKESYSIGNENIKNEVHNIVEEKPKLCPEMGEADIKSSIISATLLNQNCANSEFSQLLNTETTVQTSNHFTNSDSDNKVNLNILEMKQINKIPIGISVPKIQPIKKTQCLQKCDLIAENLPCDFTTKELQTIIQAVQKSSNNELDTSRINLLSNIISKNTDHLHIVDNDDDDIEIIDDDDDDDDDDIQIIEYSSDEQIENNNSGVSLPDDASAIGFISNKMNYSKELPIITNVVLKEEIKSEDCANEKTVDLKKTLMDNSSINKRRNSSKYMLNNKCDDLKNKGMPEKDKGYVDKIQYNESLMNEPFISLPLEEAICGKEGTKEVSKVIKPTENLSIHENSDNALVFESLKNRNSSLFKDMTESAMKPTCRLKTTINPSNQISQSIRNQPLIEDVHSQIVTEDITIPPVKNYYDFSASTESGNLPNYSLSTPTCSRQLNVVEDPRLKVDYGKTSPNIFRNYSTYAKLSNISAIKTIPTSPSPTSDTCTWRKISSNKHSKGNRGENISPLRLSSEVGSRTYTNACEENSLKTANDLIGKQIISPKEALTIILSWVPNWLKEAEALAHIRAPPICGVPYFQLQQATLKFNDVEEYFNILFPMMLHDLFFRIRDCYKQLKNTGNIKKLNLDIIKISYNDVIDLQAKLPNIKEMPYGLDGHLGIATVTLTSGLNIDVFVQVFYQKLVKENNSEFYYLFMKTTYPLKSVDMAKKMTFFGVYSLSKALFQIKALNLQQYSLRNILLNPCAPHCTKITLERVGNVRSSLNIINRAVENIKFRLAIENSEECNIVIIDSPLGTDLMSTLITLVEDLKKTKNAGEKSRILLCVRSSKHLEEIGLRLLYASAGDVSSSALNTIILSKPSHIQDPELRKITLQEKINKFIAEIKRTQFTEGTEALYADARKHILENCDIFLSIILQCYDPTIHNIFKTMKNFRFTCCIVSEAYLCTESETLLPFLYGIRKLALIGDPFLKPKAICPQIERLHYYSSLVRRLTKNIE